MRHEVGLLILNEFKFGFNRPEIVTISVQVDLLTTLERYQLEIEANKIFAARCEVNRHRTTVNG